MSAMPSHHNGLIDLETKRKKKEEEEDKEEGMQKETKKQNTTLIQSAFGHVTSSQQEKLTNTVF